MDPYSEHTFILQSKWGVCRKRNHVTKDDILQPALRRGSLEENEEKKGKEYLRVKHLLRKVD